MRTQDSIDLLYRYFNGDLTDRETEALRKHLASNPEAQAEFIRITRREAMVVEELKLREEKGRVRTRAARPKRRVARYLPPIAAAAALILVFAWIFRPGVRVDVAEFSARVAEKRGNPQIVVAGKRSSLTVNDTVTRDQTIRTGADGYVKLLYEDGSMIELQEETVSTIGVDERHAGKKIRLDDGRLAAHIATQTGDREMVFTTPHARAEVLGTGLTLRILDGGTRLDVENGLVRFSDLEGRRVEVPSGHYALAEPGSAPVAVMDSVDYEDFSRLRKQHRDAEVISKDDFETGMGTWTAFESTGKPGYRIRRTASDVPEGRVDLTEAERDGERSRVLCLDTPIDSDLQYGIGCRLPPDIGSVLIESRTCLQESHRPGVHGNYSLASFTYPPGTKAVGLAESPSLELQKGTWHRIRNEYVFFDTDRDAPTLDVKIFQDNRLLKWARFTGAWKSFAPKIAFHCGTGRLLLDDIVVRKLRPRPVSDGLIASYAFDQGKGVVIPPSPGPAGMEFRIGNPSVTRWLPGALRAAGAADITSADEAGTLRDAWNRSKALSFEAWFRAPSQTHDLGYEYVVFLVKTGSGESALEISARVRPLVPRPDSVYVHLVTTCAADGDTTTTKFYVNGKRSPGSERSSKALANNLRDGPISIVLMPRDIRRKAKERLFSRVDFGSFAVYGRELSPEEIRRNYESQPLSSSASRTLRTE